MVVIGHCLPRLAVAVLPHDGAVDGVPFARSLDRYALRVGVILLVGLTRVVLLSLLAREDAGADTATGIDDPRVARLEVADRSLADRLEHAPVRVDLALILHRLPARQFQKHPLPQHVHRIHDREGVPAEAELLRACQTRARIVTDRRYVVLRRELDPVVALELARRTQRRIRVLKNMTMRDSISPGSWWLPSRDNAMVNISVGIQNCKDIFF